METNAQTEPFQYTLQVAWGEMDALLHVNNVHYFRYVETARVAYFESIGLLPYLLEHQIGCLVASQSCQYIRPVTYPDSLIIAVRAFDIEGPRFKLAYAISSEQQQKVVAKANTTMVCVNLETQKKVELPDEVIKCMRPNRH